VSLIETCRYEQDTLLDGTLSRQWRFRAQLVVLKSHLLIQMTFALSIHELSESGRSMMNRRQETSCYRDCGNRRDRDDVRTDSGARRWLMMLAWLACLLCASAQSQTPIDRFAPDVDNVVLATAVQPDGRIVLGGMFTTVDGQVRNHVARLNAEGSVDSGFDAGTGANGDVHAVAVQPDGKILLGGLFTSIDGQLSNHIARLNADGSLDGGFNVGAGANGSVHALLVLPDGKLLLSGDFTSIDSQPLQRIARLKADGSVDLSFNPGTGANAAVLALASQSGGSILLGGEFTSIDGQARAHIARLNSTGGLDPTFAPSASTNAFVRTLAVQADERIVLGGDFSLVNGQPNDYIARLHADGSLDASFNPVVDAALYAITIQPDGKLLLGGVFSAVNGQAFSGISRLRLDGTVDPDFYAAASTNGPVRALAVQPDGKLLLGGAFTDFGGLARNRIARLYPDGSPDTVFDTGTSFENTVSGLAMQPDHKVALVGGFFFVDGQEHRGVARLNNDGNLDSDFIDPSLNSGLFDVAVNPDRRLLLAGNVTYGFGLDCAERFCKSIIRLLPDGTRDYDFYPRPGVSENSGKALAVQRDGRITVVGNFQQLGGGGHRGLARLFADGTVDASFDPGVGVNDGSQVNALALQPDGKLLVGGDFTQIVGQSRNYLARLNVDGSLDTSFSPIVNLYVYSLAVQADGKILVAGLFTEIDGQPHDNMARLNPDGSLDNTFNASFGVDPVSFAYGMALQADGRIVVGGEFTDINGQPRNNIARLNTDGSLDLTFYPGTGATGGAGGVFSVGIQSDGKIVLAGAFQQLDGQVRHYAGRLTNPDAALQTLRVGANRASVEWLRAGASPELAYAWFELSLDDGDTWLPLGDAQRISGGWSLSSLSLPRNVPLLVRALGRAASGTGNGAGSLFESRRQIYLPQIFADGFE
jgi:uncharacterized delta-60 repeat protein